MADDQVIKEIRSLSFTELEKVLLDMGEKAYRSRQIWEWLWVKSARCFRQMSNLPEPLRQKLSEQYALKPLNMAGSEHGRDGSVRYAFSCHDGHITEGVLIPAGKRVTACLSSQIGCPLKCTFCATGQMKYIRNLTAGEIVDQFALLNRESDKIHARRLSNVVFMGMGEPLLNYDHVIKAIGILSDRQGIDFSSRRITLSTAGIGKMIRQLADDRFGCQLAVSLHSANNSKRDRLMPLNRSNPLDELSSAIAYFHKNTGIRISYEYLMLMDFNDTLEDARELAGFCRISPCKINLIEYNPIPGSPFQGSPWSRIIKFREYLERKNLAVSIRKSKGSDIAAACGQLAGKIKSNA